MADTDDQARAGQGAPRAHRRRDHGLQARARGDRRRPRRGRREAAREGRRECGRKAGRDAREGLVSSYIHTGGRLGVLIEVNCETDFVARNDDFQKLVRELAMQVAGFAPTYATDRRHPRRDRRGASRAELARRSESVHSKPSRIRGKIVEGQLASGTRRSCSTSSPSATRTRRSASSSWTPSRKIGENIRVRRFVRYQLGRSCDRGPDAEADASAGTDARRYHRILLKLSGEALMGSRTVRHRPAGPASFIAPQVARVQAAGVEVADRRRRRQHLPRPRRGGQAAWSARPATTWACSRRS